MHLIFFYRERSVASSVSKSVGVLDFSGKDKSSSSTAKPPRRLSIPAKTASVTPGPRMSGIFTPIPEARTRRATYAQGRSDTPVCANNRMRFTMLSKSSYWLSHIKVSESSGQHSISLGFFKLALEAGCEVMLLLSISSILCHLN